MGKLTAVAVKAALGKPGTYQDGDPAYPLLLFQRMITVSLETMKIVRGLPALDILPGATTT